MLSKSESIMREVLMERRRQVEKFGYTSEQDEGWEANELAEAACYMAWPSDSVTVIVLDDRIYDVKVEELFPSSSWDIDTHTYREGRTPRERLIIAGAFILAEIERLDNARGPVLVGST